ncbi:hypothetical protein F511_29007 [Dorcoceras hygrometricum]|uniref:Dystroglycan-like n=1 Tax=Dorcoceras hygrometricum TaxID=472368 RepID=A0A2Z7D7D9_9LAMI|nr:hypothetical protein F511_29007 [Dorcoceras hygrometricum]
MASSLISSSHHIDFDSGFGFDDAELVQMFESLITMGLKVFLGCPAVFYEAAHTEFFANSSVRNGVVVSTIMGTTIEISEEVFSTTFELPTEGLTDLSEVPKNLVFDARSLFSESMEQVSVSCLKKELKIAYRLLSDILTKTIYVKVGSFDAVTRDRFMLMTAITFDVKVNWSSLLFGILKEMVTPGSRVLTEKTVHSYVVINEKVGTEEVADAPRVKKTPVKKVVSQKRPAAVDVEIAPVVKKKRTTKGKLVVIAQEAVPLQIIEGTAAVPVEQPPVPKQKIQKIKRRLVLEAEDEIVDDQPAAEAATGMKEPVIENEQAVTEPAVEIPEAEIAVDRMFVEPVVDSVSDSVFEPAVATVVNEGPSTTDDVDDILQQVLTETAQLETTDEGDPVDEPDASGAHVEDQPAGPAAERPWFDLPYEDIIDQLNDRPVVTPSDTDEDELIIDAVTETGAATDCVVGEPVDEEMGNYEGSVNVRIDAEEAMSLEDIILSIPVGVHLPSAGVEITKIILGQTVYIPGVDEGDWYKASLPKIHPEEKGKEPLQLKDLAKVKPPQENYSLICADIDLLVQLREQVIDDVAKFFYSFSLKKLAQLQIDESYFEKEALVLLWAEAESTGVPLQRKLYILLKYREILVRKFLESWQQNFVAGEGTSAVDLKVIHLLSDLNSFILEELKHQTVAHGLRWNKTCFSQLFEGRSRTPSAAPTSTKFEVSRQRSYDDTLPSMSAFFKLMKKWWGDVCLEVAEFCASRRLLPVVSLNFCRALAVVEPVSNFDYRRPTAFALRLSQFCTTFIHYSLFSSLTTEDIRNFVGSIASERTILRNVQIIQNSGSVASNVQSSFVSASARQDGQNHSDLHLLHLNEFKKSVMAHNVTVIADFMDVKKAVRELNAKVDVVSTRLDDVRQDIEDTKEAISHQLLDFQAQVQANHNILTGQLSELVNYINRGDNDRKGEGSSRGPQPPHDDQNIDSGIASGGGDTDRSIVEILITADRQRQRERSRGHSSESYKRRRY